MYAPAMPPQRHNSVAMGMVAGTTMAMSAGERPFVFLVIQTISFLFCSDAFIRSRSTPSLDVVKVYFASLCFSGTLLTTQSPASVAPHQVTMPTYRHPGTPSYSYVPPQWWKEESVSRLFFLFFPNCTKVRYGFMVFACIQHVCCFLCCLQMYISTCFSPAGQKMVDMHSHSSVFCYWGRPALPVSATSYSSSSIMWILNLTT